MHGIVILIYSSSYLLSVLILVPAGCKVRSKLE
uniref:Uncharacterized protein n=1 Tax=Musa acuminata subsp. malaccensis TaxID=214687 RepID=A0A804I1A5_MUSAM